MKNKRTITWLHLALYSSIAITLASCTETPSSPALNSSVVAFWTDIDNSGAHSSQLGVRSGSFTTVDSIQVTSAAFVASGFEFRNDLNDSGSNDNVNSVQIHTEQFLLAFDQNGRQYLGERLSPAGTYLSARFDLHPIFGNSDSLQSALGPYFQSLFGGSAFNKTIVIKGFVVGSEQSIPFTYISTMSGSERVPFDSPLVISGSGDKIVMIVKFRTARAFLSNGMLMDPRDGNNAAAINANLKMALDASM